MGDFWLAMLSATGSTVADVSPLQSKMVPPCRPCRPAPPVHALDSSRDVAFLATGTGKRAAVAGAKAGDGEIRAAMVRPVGRLNWFTEATGGAN
jgi:hypothetical protein